MVLSRLGGTDGGAIPPDIAAELPAPDPSLVASANEDPEAFQDPLAGVPPMAPRPINALVLSEPPGNVTFDFEGISPKLEADIRSMVGLTSAWVARELDYELDGFTVVGRSTVRELVDSQVGDDAPFPRALLESEWQVAAGMAMGNVIYLKLDGPYLEYEPDWLRGTLLRIVAHELGHTLAGQLGQNAISDAPLWLKEGLAELQAAIVADAAGFDHYDWLRDEATSGARRIAAELDGLHASGPFSGGSTDPYLLGFLATDYLTSNGDLLPIADFWRLVGDGMPWKPAFSAAFGIDIEAFADDFELYRAANFPVYPGQILGTVSTANGSADPGVHVWACGVTSYECFHATTDLRGAFSVAVPSDRYRIQFGDAVDEYGIDYPPLEAMYFATDGNTFNENDATVLRVFASPVTGLEIRR
jgi:hypothetical protein